jgi:hypothetical protein
MKPLIALQNMPAVTFAIDDNAKGVFNINTTNSIWLNTKLPASATRTLINMQSSTEHNDIGMANTLILSAHTTHSTNDNNNIRLIKTTVFRRDALSVK